MIQIPPTNTLLKYQAETLGSPNESIIDNKNKASNTANPRRRLEKVALLLRPPLENKNERYTTFEDILYVYKKYIYSQYLVSDSYFS